ncbi:MAG: ABC transporter ATP-binding protein, partial [Archangium sp.]
MASPHSAPRPPQSLKARLKNTGSLFRQLPGTFRLFWAASRRGAVVLGALTLVAAVLPAGIAWVGKLIVDGIVAAQRAGDGAGREHVLRLVLLEFGLMAGSMVVDRALGLTRELLRANLGNLLNERILQKALELELRHFEDSDTYDKMQNARREASSRPLDLVMNAFAIVRNVVTLSTYAVLLVSLSPWSVVVLATASIPAFIAEARLAAEGFRLYSWRAPEGRKLNYLEWILTRDNHVKEVKVFGLGPLVLGRYRTLFQKFFQEDRALALKRMGWGLGLGLVSLGAFYGCYLFVANRATLGALTMGDVVLYLGVFRQGQAAFQGILSSVGSMYEGALFMSNLFAYLEIPTGQEAPRMLPAHTAPRGRGNAIELRDVSFR